MADIAIEKRRKKMTKKRQKRKLAEEVHAVITKIQKEEEQKKKKELNKKEMKIKKRIRSLRRQRIEDISKRIKKAAEEGDSYIHISALWSDTVEIRLQGIIQKWAKQQGFEIETSYNDIYEPPHCSDDLPSDTRGFLTISWL